MRARGRDCNLFGFGATTVKNKKEVTEVKRRLDLGVGFGVRADDQV